MEVINSKYNMISRRHFLIKAGVGIFGASSLGSLLGAQRWKYIVIHHSAGKFGNPEFLRKVRRERQGRSIVNSMAYHFIIGNGSGMDIGHVAHDARWRYQLWGQHVSIRNSDHNLRGIGICLVGNFEKHVINERQYKALLSFTRGLMKKYSIVPENVKGHGYIHREKTLCPGRHFPMQQFNEDIRAA